MSLPLREWRCTNSQPHVTLVGEQDRDGDRHFRFRAEAPGEATIRFASTTAGEVTVAVRIAPEHLT